MIPLLRVLLVDDHAVVRKGIRAVLSTEADIEVVGKASDGEEALVQAAALQPDVILMDLVIPKMDGIEATRQVTTRQLGSRIMVLTSFVGHDKVFPAIKAGALGYVLKDTGPDDLVRAIRQVHRSEPTLEPEIARKVLFELAQPPRQPLLSDPLTGRELDVLCVIAQDKGNREISEDLVLTDETVRTHVSNILGKLHLASRTQAALYAPKEGFVSFEYVLAALI